MPTIEELEALIAKETTEDSPANIHRLMILLSWEKNYLTLLGPMPVEILESLILTQLSLDAEIEDVDGVPHIADLISCLKPGNPLASIEEVVELLGLMVVQVIEAYG